jgi:hypothetical protein
MLTKITRQPFKNIERSSKVLDLIHSDVCDLHGWPTIGGKKYFVTFIDDCTRFCYVYLMHSKDEVLDKFKIFKAQVELQHAGTDPEIWSNGGICIFYYGLKYK